MRTYLRTLRILLQQFSLGMRPRVRMVCPQRTPLHTSLRHGLATTVRSLVVGFCLVSRALSQLLSSSLTLCLADRPVRRPQRIPHCCTPLQGTGSHPQRSCQCFSAWYARAPISTCLLHDFICNIMVYGSTPYVGMAPKKMAATLKVHK